MTESEVTSFRGTQQVTSFVITVSQ